MAKKKIQEFKVTAKTKVALIERGARLSKQIKKLESDLKEVKEDLKCLKVGKHLTDTHCVTVSESDKFDPIDPIEAKNMLRSNRKGPQFVHCVTVKIAELRKYLSEEDIKELQGESTGVSRRYSFK